MRDVKTFHPDVPGDGVPVAHDAPPVTTTEPPQRSWAPVHVAEVTAEDDPSQPPEIPLHLLGEPGTIALQLRTTVHRVAIGAGLARRAELVEAVRTIAGLPGLTTSPAGGTFIVGGEGWLGLCAVGRPHPGQPMPLDWMADSLYVWFSRALAGYGVELQVGKVDGGWCPGFSDIAVGGRKLIGLGFRVTGEWVVMRGVMPVRPIDDLDLRLLVETHRLIDVDVRREANTSLVECTGDGSLTVPAVIERTRSLVTEGGTGRPAIAGL